MQINYRRKATLKSSSSSEKMEKEKVEIVDKEDKEEEIEKGDNVDENNTENWEESPKVDVIDAPTPNNGNDVSVNMPCHTSANATGTKNYLGNTDLSVQNKELATDPDNFIELVSKQVFVDKSLLIQEILNGSEDHILITRPRSWGKTLAMDMLKTFFQPEVDDFGTHNFKINKYREEFKALKINNKQVSIKNDETGEIQQVNIVHHFQGHYPVIFITFSNINAKKQDILSGIKTSISIAFREHQYLLRVLYNVRNDSTKNEADRDFATDSIKNFEEISLNSGREVSEIILANSIYILSELLREHFNQKVVILIDEYDAPLNSTSNSEHYDIVLATLRPILQNALKNNGHLKKCIITGKLRIAKADLFSGLNNFCEFNVLNKKFAEFFGFTEQEVDGLLENSSIKTPDIETSSQKNTVKHWYNGYQIGGCTMYNPWSIMRCLSNGEVGSYWIQTGNDSDLKAQLLKKADDPIFNKKLQELLLGNTVTVILTDMFSAQDFASQCLNEDALWGLLLFSGYITIVNLHLIDDDDDDDDGSYSCNVKIPNIEVRRFYNSVFIQWVVQQALSIPDRLEYISLYTNLLGGDIEEFQRQLIECLTRSTSFHHTGGKSAQVFYNGLMQGLLLSISETHYIEAERQSGEGRSVKVLLPKINSRYDKAIILEYKVSDSLENLRRDASLGLNQIISLECDTLLRNIPHLKSVVKMSVAFFKKSVQIEYVKDDLPC